MLPVQPFSKSRLLVTFLILSVLGVALHGQEAAMFRADPQHSGLFNAPGVPKDGKVKWKFHTNGQVISSPAVVGDTVYVGSGDYNLYAINLSDGSLKWKFKTKGRVHSSPAVAAGVVYFGSYDSYFYAVDAATGKELWKFQTGGERRYAATHIHGAEPAAQVMPDPFDFYLSSPALANGTVFFGSGDHNIYALDAASGTLKWKFSTGDVVHASPAVADGTVYIGSWDSFFYAIDASSGKEKWRFKTGEDPDIHNQVGIQASALVSGGVVYFGCRDSKLYALDAQSGAKRWEFNNKVSWVIGSAAVKDGKLYFTTSDSGMFHAVDASSGASLYSIKFIWPMFSSPTIAGNTLYLGSHQGKLIAIDLATQKPAWTFQTDASKTNGPKYTNPDGTTNYEVAFGRDPFYDAIVIGVDKLMSFGAMLSTPAVAGDVVYVGSMDGNLYALN
jgi:outer membrane protein assembly factor BamB